MKLAEAGIGLLELLLDKLEQGEPLAETIQNEAEASSMSYPDKTDFEVSTAWAARRCNLTGLIPSATWRQARTYCGWRASRQAG